MSETQIQAVLVFVRVVVLAAIAGAVGSLTVLKDAIGDPIYATAFFAIGTAILNALAKLVGGPTTPVEQTALGFAGNANAKAPRPNILSV